VNFKVKPVIGMAIALSAFAVAQSPLPELSIEPVGGGSIFIIKNTAPLPVSAYYIELVGYPGSSYVLIQDDVASPIPPGTEKRLRTESMTAGAAPTYMKLLAALFVDGSSSGAPDKISQIIEHRRMMLKATREAIQRLDKAKSAGKPALIADLKQWEASIPEPVRKYRYRAAEINQADTKSFIIGIEKKVETGSVDSALTELHASEKAMAASKPAL